MAPGLEASASIFLNGPAREIGAFGIIVLGYDDRSDALWMATRCIRAPLGASFGESHQFAFLEVSTKCSCCVGSTVPERPGLCS
jgi:hypothetical protein